MVPSALLDAAEIAPSAPRAEPLWQKSPCILCGVGCGLLVGIEGGRAGAVKGDPDSAVSHGLACARGYYSVQALYGRDRLTRALVRRGGALVPVPVSDALDLVAARLQETVSRTGANSVALYGSAQRTVTDAYMAARLFRELGSGNVASSTRLYAGSAAAGLESSFGLDGAVGCYEDIDHADVFVLWDANLAETDPVLFSRMLERRRRSRTVRIIDLTTRTTRTSYAADTSLLHAPQSALAIANAICQEIVARKAVNRGFVDRHVAFRRGRTDIGHGMTDDRLVTDAGTEVSFQDYVAFLATATPEQAQRLSGVPADRIRWLASLYADRSRKVVSVWGANANRHTRGTWLNNALYNIHLLVGKIATPGNGAFSVTGEPAGGVDVADSAAGQWTGPAPLGMFRALQRGDIRFLWIQSGNPLASLPNVGRYAAAVARSDRFIVVSDAYPTATTDVADVVLPAALWFEREGVILNDERRVQHFEQMVTPPGDAMSEAEQIVQVARRLGLASRFPGAGTASAERAWEEYRRSRGDRRNALPTIAELRRERGLRWPYAGGRETKWRYNTAHDPAANKSRGAFDFYGHPDGRAWIWLRPHQPPVESPDREYPFWLSSGGVLEHSESSTLTRRIPTLHRAAPRTYAEFNRQDAERMSIRRGDLVRLVSRRGALDIEARVEHRSQPPRGHVFVPDFDESLPVQRLMPDAFCPLSGQPHTMSCAVRVERISRRSGV